MLVVHAQDHIGATGCRPFGKCEHPCADASAGPLPELTKEKLRLRVMDVQHHPRPATARSTHRPHQIGGNVVHLHDANRPPRADTGNDPADPEKELEIAPAVTQQAGPAVAPPRPAQQHDPVQPADAALSRAGQADVHDAPAATRHRLAVPPDARIRRLVRVCHGDIIGIRHAGHTGQLFPALLRRGELLRATGHAGVSCAITRGAERLDRPAKHSRSVSLT